MVHSLRAQETDKHSPWAVTLLGGRSMPAGGSRSMSGDPYIYHFGYSGRPLPGPSFGGMAEYGLSPLVVGVMQVNYARMAAEDLGEVELFPYFPGGALGGGIHRTGFNQDQGDWEVGQLLGGIGIRGEEGRLSFNMRIEAGAQWTRSPAVEVNEYGTTWTLDDPFYGTYSTRTVQPSVKAWSVVAGGRIDLGIALGPCIVLRLGAALHTSSVSLPYTWETTYHEQRNNGPDPYPGDHSRMTSIEVKQPVTTYLITFGVTYRFPSGDQ